MTLADSSHVGISGRGNCTKRNCFSTIFGEHVEVPLSRELLDEIRPSALAIIIIIFRGDLINKSDCGCFMSSICWSCLQQGKYLFFPNISVLFLHFKKCLFIYSFMYLEGREIEGDRTKFPPADSLPQRPTDTKAKPG